MFNIIKRHQSRDKGVIIHNHLEMYKNIDRNSINSVYVFTNARDEPNIAEWIAHYILLGFDKVIVFDHLSVIPIEDKIKTDFDGKLKVINVNGSGNIKVELMKRAVVISKHEKVDWMLYVDSDEFLTFNKITNVKDYLKHFSNADMIGINWLMFGNSGFEKQPAGLLTENFTRSENILNRHVKSFVRPLSVVNISNPHFFLIINPERSLTSIGTKLKPNPFNYINTSYKNVPVYVCHYYIQSTEEFMRRKGRPMDDGTNPYIDNVIMSEKIKYNDVLNDDLKTKYSQKIKEFLNKYDIVL